MPVEKLVIYIVLAAFFFVKFVADTLKRHRALQEAERAPEPEPAAQEQSERWWEPLVEPAKPAERQAQLRAEPRPVVVPLPRPPEPPVRPAKREAAARAKRKAAVQPAVRHRIALGNPAELRRAVELMAILGPPRSIAPYDS